MKRIEDKERILNKLMNFDNIEIHIDDVILSDDEFYEKYHGWGYSFKEFIELRLDREIKISEVLKGFLKDIDLQCYLYVIDGSDNNLTGLGNYIKKRLKKRVKLKFDNYIIKNYSANK